MWAHRQAERQTNTETGRQAIAIRLVAWKCCTRVRTEVASSVCIQDEVLDLKNRVEDWQDKVILQGENQSAAIAQLQEEITELKDTIRTMQGFRTEAPVATNERNAVE